MLLPRIYSAGQDLSDCRVVFFLCADSFFARTQKRDGEVDREKRLRSSNARVRRTRVGAATQHNSSPPVLFRPLMAKAMSCARARGTTPKTVEAKFRREEGMLVRRDGWRELPQRTNVVKLTA
jgi:hypothetical protein